ncbi:MAG: polysaccharide biosynthesis tyrosine autokinase, partial [Bacteroidales bacterium]|nr:polysaccharide biosynthesis tyrosine autokinase [Bacteroidales bacterium]
LTSFKLTERDLEKLNFDISYFQVGKLVDIEVYKSAPFIIDFNRSHIQALTKIYVDFIDSNKIYVSSETNEVFLYNYSNNNFTKKVNDFVINDTISFNEIFENEYLSFKILKNHDFLSRTKNNNNYAFTFRSFESQVREFHSFEIKNIEYSSVINLILDGVNINKAKDFLRVLSSEYLLRGVEKENQVAVNTIEFINNQLTDISTSLKESEHKLETYRSTEKVMNIDFQSQQVYNKLENLQNKKAELLLKLKYYKYLEQYLNENQNYKDIIAPSAMGIEDQLLNKLLSELSNMYTEKIELLTNSKKDNPFLEGLKLKINNQKKTLIENVASYINQANISLDDINKRIENISERVRLLPETQRKLFNYEREFQLNDAIYTFLLKKRSEMQIAKASNLPKHEMLDEPRLVGVGQISPNKKMIFIIAFILGLGIPIGIIIILDYFNDKIDSIDKIEKLSDFPIIGNILRSKENSELVIRDNPNSLIAEAFRNLRTNFQYFTKRENSQTVLVTSSMAGEGKSFVTMNLASSFALFGKKVLLLSFDLRRPVTENALGLKTKMGLSTYLSANCDYDDIIQKTNTENLFAIGSGPIPPNPSELIASDRTNELFLKLKKEFDLIFIDTPPVGIVADSLILMEYSDVNLFIVRHNLTKEKFLKRMFKNFESKKITNLNIVVNDIKMNSPSYEYNYGYSSAYYSKK